MKLSFVSACFAAFTWMAHGAELTIDWSRTNGILRALHGINKGPLPAGGFFDLTEQLRALGIPFTRLHDCHWPNPDVVDIHAVFPDFSRDPSRPESYDFVRTDEYLAAIQRTGAQIIYRLGESIEHEKTKRFVHPPADAKKWAEICLGIIRHYNDGWANGYRYGIRYWEIWNEPENRPAMWTGTDEQFMALYAMTASAIKARFPQLKVGGPGFGYTGEILQGELRAGGLLTNFLAICRRESLPLDFLSWHCYTDDPEELGFRARGVRRILDAQGFVNVESHLNEWNFLPGHTWQPISKTSGTPDSRQRFYAEMASAQGAAFIVAALIRLQDAPVDVCNLFHGEAGAFGLFSEHGVPQKNYYALRAFSELLHTPRRLTVHGDRALSVAAGLGIGGDKAAVLISNLDRPQSELILSLTNLPWHEPADVHVRVLDGAHDFDDPPGSIFDGRFLRFTLRRPAVAFVSIQRRR